MGASLDYLFAYDATTDRIPDWCYSALCEQWLEEKDIQRFLHDNNPWVLRDMAERLLEAANRGMWESASLEKIAILKQLVYTSEAQIESKPDDFLPVK